MLFLIDKKKIGSKKLLDLQTPEMYLPECKFQTNYQSLKNIYKVFTGDLDSKVFSASS